MKATVKQTYRDRETGVIHNAGETVELTAARAHELEEGGFVKAALIKKPESTEEGLDGNLRNS